MPLLKFVGIPSWNTQTSYDVKSKFLLFLESISLWDVVCFIAH